MYDVAGVFPVDAVSPATHLLGVSPPMLGADRLAHRFLARGLDTGDGAVVVSTDRNAAAVAESVGGYAESGELDRLGVVDATGQGAPTESVPYRVEAVGSPADLTGIGIGVSELLQGLHADGVDGYRVVVDSLSSLLVYAGFERLYQFTHTVTNQIDRIDGTSLFLLSADTEGDDVARFQGLFDGRIEFRERDGTVEYRLKGLGLGDPTDWQAVEPEGVPDATGPGPEIGRAGDDGAAGVAGRGESSLGPIGSLHDAIERVTAAGYTLTLCNHSGDGEMLAELRDYFGRLNVTVRTDELRRDTPSDVAILHRGGDGIALSPVTELYNATRWAARGDDTDLTGMVHPSVLDHVFRQEYTVENGGKLQMVRISRLIETRALDSGTGTLHAGFQRLNRVRDELGTRDLYESIAETSVDVHLYGRPGDLPNAERYTLHTGAEGELAASWFVVYDGGVRGVRAGALVSEETGPDEYTGFWTYQPDLVAAVDEYLRATYGSATHR